MGTRRDEEIFGYQIAEEPDDERRTELRGRNSAGEDVLIFFTTRERAEAFCLTSGILRPWPIDTLTRLEAKALAYAASKKGTRFLCLDPAENSGKCREISLFLAEMKD